MTFFFLKVWCVSIRVWKGLAVKRGDMQIDVLWFLNFSEGRLCALQNNFNRDETSPH